MKKIYTTFLLLFTAFLCFSQSQTINFQGVARNADGDLLIEQNTTLVLALKYGTPTAATTYSESHSVTTDQAGTFSVKIGAGSPISGSYSDMIWGVDTVFLTVYVNGSEVGTTELNAVPYALASAKATSMELSDLTDISGAPSPGDLLTFDGSNWAPSSPPSSSLWSEDGSSIYRTTGSVGIGTSTPETNYKLHVRGALFVQSNAGGFHLGYPDGGNVWNFETASSGANLILRNKLSGSDSFTNLFGFHELGEFSMGGITNPLAWAHLKSNSTRAKANLLLQEDGDDEARLQFANTLNTISNWQIGATAFDGGATEVGQSKMKFNFKGTGGSSDVFTLKGNGRVGVNNTNPDEELVIGTNLGSGWTFPAATIGGPTGGVVQVGNTEYKFSAESSSVYQRARIIASDPTNGFGQGFIEMRTRQLNIGRNPGVSRTRPYPLRVVQNISGQGGAFGLNLVNGNDTDAQWEFFVSQPSVSDGDMSIYYANSRRGTFDAISGNYSSASDRNLKTNIKKGPAILDKLDALQIYQYNYKKDPSKKYNGVIAQEAAEVFPEIVNSKPPREGEKSVYLVDYSQLTAIAIKAIKEQQEIIKELKKRIEILEKK